MPKRLLVVDDDELMRQSLTFNLSRAGYQVRSASNGEDALAIAGKYGADLVLLDIGLPGMDGLEALRRFRDHFDVPVIFLTARRRELDQLLGLELGADDYITKPFDTDILLARVKAVLRRMERPLPVHPSPEQLTAGDLTIDPGAHTVTLAGKPLDLPPRQFDLLYTLALSAGKVVPVETLLNRVWGPEFDGQPEVLYVHIRWLREKLEDDPAVPRRIVTVRGVGYRLEPREVNG